MAGNAAGIAKANAARLEKRRLRAEALARINDATTASDGPTVTNDAPISAPLPVVDRSEGETPQNQVSISERILTAAEPEAANTVYRIASGKLRAPVAVRAQVSLAVLQGRGLLGVKPGAGAVDLEAAAGAVLAKLEGAMRFRDRRESAADAKILSSGRVLDAEKPDGSGS